MKVLPKQRLRKSPCRHEYQMPVWIISPIQGSLPKSVKNMLDAITPIAKFHARAKRGFLRGGPGLFLEAALHEVALRLVEVIQDEFSVQMVDFMLEHAGENLARVENDCLALQVQCAHAHRLAAADFLGDPRNREAALLHDPIAGGAFDLGVDEKMNLFGVFPERDVDHNEPDVLPHLGGGEADAGRIVHGGEHRAREFRRLLRDALDGQAFPAKGGRRIFKNFQNGHERFPGEMDAQPAHPPSRFSIM